MKSLKSQDNQPQILTAPRNQIMGGTPRIYDNIMIIRAISRTLLNRQGLLSPKHAVKAKG
jgi:hypothetical protein